MRWILWIWLPAILLVAHGAEAATEAEKVRSVSLMQHLLVDGAMETEQVRGLLEKMQAEEAWGEAVFTDGRVRSLRVQEIEADSVAVVEVVGALQEREAAYALAEFRSLRTLGTQRIQSRRAAFQQSKSGLLAFLLELPVPGAGYFYIGEHKQGLVLMGLTVTAVGTAFLTGADTAAGWAPLSAWIKIASLFHLRDQVQSINKVAKSLELGALPGRETTVPALRLKLSF